MKPSALVYELTISPSECCVVGNNTASPHAMLYDNAYNWAISFFIDALKAMHKHWFWLMFYIP